MAVRHIRPGNNPSPRPAPRRGPAPRRPAPSRGPSKPPGRRPPYRQPSRGPLPRGPNRVPTPRQQRRLRLPVPLNRVGTYYNYAWQIYRFWNALDDVFGRGLPDPVTGRAHKYSNRNISVCSGGGGPAVTNQSWPSCGKYVIGPQWVSSRNATHVWVWGRWVSKVNQFSPNSFYEAGYKISKANANDYAPQSYQPLGYNRAPGGDLAPGLGPRASTPLVPTPVPRGLSPAQPDAPGMRETSNGPGSPAPRRRGDFTYDTDPTTHPGTDPGGQPGTDPFPGTDPHTPRPPRPGEREKKARAHPAVVRLAGIAYQATETKDVIDEIFKALPKHIRDAVPKSGRLRKGARLGHGTAYATTYDKALHLYRNLHRLDVSQAFKNLIRNHVEDEILGRANAKADEFSRRNLRGARFLNIS